MRPSDRTLAGQLTIAGAKELFKNDELAQNVQHFHRSFRRMAGWLDGWMAQFSG